MVKSIQAVPVSILFGDSEIICGRFLAAVGDKNVLRVPRGKQPLFMHLACKNFSNNPALYYPLCKV